MKAILYQFYGGPKDGQTVKLSDPLPKGQLYPSPGMFSYIYDGAGRFLWTGYLEGHMLEIELEDQRRGKT